MTERFGSEPYAGDGFMPRWLPGPGFDMPGRIVEVAFGNNANDPIASMVWTDITEWVREAETHRGKQHERNVVQAGTATFLLNNRDGRFSPWNTASPYYPNVEPMRPIRLRASWNATTYPVWFGYVESWPMKWADAVNSDVEVAAVDGFAILANKKLTRSAYNRLVLASTARSYWRMGDAPRGNTAVDSSGNGHNGIYYGNVGRGKPGGIFGDADTAVAFGGGGPNITDASWAEMPSGGVAGTESFTVEFLTNTPFVSVSTHLGQGTPANLQQGAYVWRFTGAQITTGGGVVEGSVYFDLGNGTGGAYKRTGVTNSLTINVDSNWHHIAATRAGNVTQLFYDGALIATGTDAGGTRSLAAAEVTLAPVDAVTLDEVAVYPSALSAATIAAHAAAALSPWQGQTTAARINAVLDLADWPTADRAIEPAQSTLAAPTSPLSSVGDLQHILDVTAAEEGLSFMAGDGSFTFFGRHHPLTNPTSTTSQATFGGGPGELPYHLDGTDVGIDYQDLASEVVVSRPDGSVQVATDPRDPPPYGPRTLEKDGTWIASDDEAFDAANWLLQQYEDPKVRVGAVSIDPRSDPANLFPVVLGLELWDRATFKRATLEGGTTFQADQLIEGVSHKITPSTWRTTFNLSPAEVQTYWIVGVSRVGIDTRVGY